ncbi:MAG TPA: hypothetical protein VN549_08085 [Negativicutes bacterium]|nr:hypothetical protein [Negativicutes bacterium]
MMFIESAEPGYAYHVVNINDLQKTLTEGIIFDDKKTYESKYVDFHNYFDRFKPESIPKWVQRKHAIFASLRFREGHSWHSHSALLKIKLETRRCWVCNENLANFIYEPFVLQSIEGFGTISEYMDVNGETIVGEYWRSSLSYEDNLIRRFDSKKGYDAEILVMHPIPPENLECLYIVSDHQTLEYKKLKEYYKKGNISLEDQYRRYLQPASIS